MPNLVIDAVKTAKSIHDGDYSSLHGKSFVIRVNMKKTKGRNEHMKKSTDKKYTLNQIGDALFEFIKSTNARFDNLEDRVEDGFKQVNSRLDYIVKANNLKDLPKSK